MYRLIQKIPVCPEGIIFKQAHKNFSFPMNIKHIQYPVLQVNQIYNPFIFTEMN